MTAYKFSISPEGKAGLAHDMAALRANGVGAMERLHAELIGPASTALPGWACRGPLGWLRDVLRRWLHGQTPEEVAQHHTLRRNAGFTDTAAGALR